jgi:hypothetical protein
MEDLAFARFVNRLLQVFRSTRRCHLKERLFRQRTKSDGTSRGQRPDMPDGMVKVGNRHICHEGEFVRKRLPVESEPYGFSYRTMAAIATDQIFRSHRLAGGETDGNPWLPLLEEAADKGRADSLISEAFDRVRSYLRTYDASGLVAKQNAECGALRNLFAVRNVFTIESTGCLIGSVIFWLAFRKPGYLWSAAGASCYLILGVVVGWRVLPRMVGLAADTYGKNAWLTFLEIANRKPPR